MKKKFLLSVIAALFASTGVAEDLELDNVTVKSSGFERKDTETTYASEIHTAKQIEASGASTLYDYLAQQSALNILSSYGNKAAPSINLRGYGSENGFQNVVITLDGQRLNNIDSTPQLLGTIPLGNIERIEISKGSGSVLYGDGANAGAIQIYTKMKTGISIIGSIGNYGQKSGLITAGLSQKYFELSASVADESYNGYSKKDILGERDSFDSETQNVKLKVRPTDALRLKAEATSSRISTFYVGTITKAELKSDPRQNSGNAYTFQRYKTDQWRLGFEYDINQNIMFSYTHGNEDKTSFFDAPQPPFPFSQLRDYSYISDEAVIKYSDENLRTLVGFQKFDGSLERTTDKTTKNNEGFFAQSEYQFDNLSLSAGARHERVSYNFEPVGNPKLTKDHNLEAFDVGMNYKIISNLSIFTNYNQAFQAPDIDRFFGFGFGFNPNIVPAKSKTFNFGLNHTTSNNRLKISTFRSDIDNEIFVVPTGFPGAFTNTNLDKTHKYGLEIQDYYQINDQLAASILYNYVRAKIDRENNGGGAFNNKDLPGVPKHSVVANLNWKFYPNTTLNLNHTWRSKAFAYNDFSNSFTQKQGIYSSTNLAVNYQYNQFTVFAAVNNLFEHENSIQIEDNGIYPVDFVRTWRVGLRADF